MTKRFLSILMVGFFLSLTPRPAPGGWPGHTPPGRWTEPRVFHTPFDEVYAGRIVIDKIQSADFATTPTLSPNGAYGFMVTEPDFLRQGPWDTVIEIDNERDARIRLTFRDHGNTPARARWINEKLLFIEVWWGRVLGTHVIFDVEGETFIYREMVHGGAIAFQQWKDAQAPVLEGTPSLETHNEPRAPIP